MAKEFRTIDKITTQGKFKADTMATAKEVLPEPELPATPIMLVFAHGGEYRVAFILVWAITVNLRDEIWTKVEH